MRQLGDYQRGFVHGEYEKGWNDGMARLWKAEVAPLANALSTAIDLLYRDDWTPEERDAIEAVLDAWTPASSRTEPPKETP